MPEIHAFRGLRYDLGQVGSLSDVVAPPYDVIGPQLQQALYKKHPAFGQPQVDRYTFEDGHSILVLAEGRELDDREAAPAIRSNLP